MSDRPGPAARLALDDLVVHGESGVLVPPQAGTAATYLDGAELYLLEALRSAGDVSLFSTELRARVRDWPSLYHLTPYRATILDALGLRARESRVLELGAGCGAVTRWLGERFRHVDAVEGSLARAQVARERCRDLPGVRVAAANFFDLDFGGLFDLATLIGVLEYSHLYHPDFGDDPVRAARSNLELARRSLCDDGILVIAIENKLGLKYLSGSHEDHAARRYEGIEGYPSRSSAVTFSAAELEQMVLEAGYSAADFYLPFPDYKLARTVLDAAAAGRSTYPANWVETPFPDRAGTQSEAPFNESLALREVASAGLLRDLANSFVVLAYNGDRDRARARLGVESGWIARHYSLDRRPAFCKRTSLEQAPDGRLVVRNIPAVPGAEQPGADLPLAQELADEPFRPGDQLLFTLHEDAAAGRLPDRLPGLLAQLRDFLLRDYGTGREDPGGVPLLRGDAIDVTWWNIVVDPEDGAWQSIDGEWRFEGLLPLDYVLWRGLHHAAARHRTLLAGSGAESPARFALEAISRLIPAVTTDRLPLYEELEAFMQHAAGAGDPGDPAEAVTPLVRGLVALAEVPRDFQVLALAEELIERPDLIAAFAAAFAPKDPATLVAYAPDADAGEIAPRLEAALASAAGQTDHDVMLVAIPSDAAAEDRLACSSHALLSTRPADGPFRGLPRVDAGDGVRLRELALRAERNPVVELPLGDGPPPLVSIVIPVFNRLDLTRQCLEAIREVTPEPAYEVIVVDNGSTDGTAGYLRAERAAGRLGCVLNPVNAGFGGACNQGAAIARGEFILLLNNDTIPRAGWLAALVETMADPSIGIAGSRLLYPDGTIQHAGIVWNELGELDHIHRGAAGNDPAVLQARDFAAVTGACLIIRRDLFHEVGAFDDAYHMYVEDVDLCIRVWAAGLRVAYCPASVLVHLENASVTDVAWRDRNVVAGWQRLHERWSGHWPPPVRRLAWPHTLPGGPRHVAVLCLADDIVAHPELLAEWAQACTDPNAVSLVVHGAGYDTAALESRLAALLESLDLGDAELDVIPIAAPPGAQPEPSLVDAVSALLASGRGQAPLDRLPWANEHGVANLGVPAPGAALAGVSG